MHLRQPGFPYSACRPFTKNKERIQKFKELEDSWCIYQNELDNTSFQHDMAYGDFKNLIRRTTSDKTLPDKDFNIDNPKHDGYPRGLVSVVYKSFDKKTSGSVIKNENISNKDLAEELHKLVIRKREKSTLIVYK